MNVPRLPTLFGGGVVVGCAAYTIWSVLTRRQIAGWLIRMQAWSDEGRYGVNFTWVLTLLTVIGLVLAVLATIKMIHAFAAGVRPPLPLRAAANARRRTIVIPSAVVLVLGAVVVALLFTGGQAMAERLGWLTKLALFCVPLTLLSWVALVEGLAPAGWHHGTVTARTQVREGTEPLYQILLDGRSYTVTAVDYARTQIGDRLGVLHTNGLFRLTITLSTRLTDGSPTTF